MSLAAQRPDLTGKVISVDGLPYLPVMINPTITPEGARNMAAGMKAQMMMPQTEEKRRESAKDTLAGMITSPENIEREMKVDLMADQATMGEAMSEMMSIDLRNEVGRIKAPVLVLERGSLIKIMG